MTRTLVRVSDGPELPDRAGRDLAPELFQPVKGPRLRREYVHDAVEVVHEDPARLAVAFDATRQQSGRALQLEVNGVVDRLRLALGVARADHEVVRVADRVAQVEQPHVDRLLVVRDLRDPLGQRQRLARIGVRGAHSPASTGTGTEAP